MPLLYPIFVDVSQRLILVVGGGAVASRKVGGLLAAGATRIRMVAPKFIGDFPAGIERITAVFSSHHLDGAELVFAATDSAQVNDDVVAQARRRGVWVNRVDGDEDDPGDFITPALLRCGAITVALSAGGSPAVAAALRDEINNCLTDRWVKLADTLRILRPVIKSANLPIDRRREIFRALSTSDAATVLADADVSALWDWACARFCELHSIPRPNI